MRRALEVVAATAVFALGATAVLTTDAQPTTTSLSFSADRTPAPARATVPLGPVTVHDLDHRPTTGPSQPAGSNSVTQTVQLTIVGGDLSLGADHATIELARHGSVWSAALPPVRVIDARGTHEGWVVRWTVADLDVEGCRHANLGPSHVRVAPTTPTVVAGTPDGLEAGREAVGTKHGRVLGEAEAGSGGGTYEIGGTVSVRLPQCRAAHDVVVGLSYTVS